MREMIAISEMESSAEKGKAAKQMIFNQGLKFDGNPDQLYTGVSSTIKYEDSDIVNGGIAAASEVNVKINKKTKIDEVISEANTEEIVERLKDILQHDDDASGVNISDFKDNNLEDLTKTGSEIIRNTNARTYRQEIKSFEEFMAKEHTEESMTENEYAAITTELQKNKERSLPITVDLAKFTFGMKKFRKAIESGDVIVISKSLESQANPDGITFANGSSVYNTIHGNVRITQYNKRKKAYKADKNGTIVTISPQQTFTPDSKQAELHKQEIRLKNKGYDKGSNAYIVAEEKINRLKLAIIGKNSIAKSSTGVLGLSVADTATEVITDKNIEAAFTFMMAFDNKPLTAGGERVLFEDFDKGSSIIANIYKKFDTNRGVEFVSGLSKLSDLKSSMVKVVVPKDDGKKVKKPSPMHPTDLEIMMDAIQNGIPYDQVHVGELLALSEAFKGDITNSGIVNTLKEVLDFYNGDVQKESKKVKYPFVDGTGAVVEKSITLVGAKTTTGKPVTAANMISALSGLGNFTKSVFELESELMDLHGMEKEDLEVTPTKKRNKDTTDDSDTAAKKATTKVTTPLSDAGKVVSKTELAEPGEDASEVEKMLYEEFEDLTQEDYNSLVKFSKTEGAVDIINSSAVMAEGKSTDLIGLINAEIAIQDRAKDLVVDDGEFLSDNEKSSNNLDDALEEWKKNNSNRAKQGSVKVDRAAKDFKSEVSRAQAMLPQVDIKVIENVVEMHRKFGTRAIGMYSDGVAYLVNNADTGTAYHEVFHAVADLYLSENEKLTIAKEYGEDSWSEKVDELAAADFEKFVADTSTTFGSIKRSVIRFFQDMMNWTKGIRNGNVTEKVFRSVSEGRYAQILTVNNVENAILSPNKITMETFNNSLLEKDKLTLQELMESGQIKILC
jgi:hypothetical protein